MSLISIKFQFIELIMIIRASPKCGDARFGFSLGSSCTCINLPLNGEMIVTIMSCFARKEGSAPLFR